MTAHPSTPIVSPPAACKEIATEQALQLHQDRGSNFLVYVPDDREKLATTDGSMTRGYVALRCKAV